LRASAELRPLQFHCGRPPPAAEPRTLINMVGKERSGARLVKPKDQGPSLLARRLVFPLSRRIAALVFDADDRWRRINSGSSATFLMAETWAVGNVGNQVDR
jgi:hypothetical protein